MADRSTKRPRSSDRKHLDSSEIKSMFKTVMRRLSAIEQEQKRYRRSLTPSFDYSTGSYNDLDHYDDDADADELITGEDESQSVQGNNNAPESVAAEYLFGKELETTIEAAKKLEKSGEQLKIKKYRPSFSTMATTSKQGNFRRPFAKGVQQMGQKVQRRTLSQNNNPRRSQTHYYSQSHRINSSVERRRRH
ncbi:unnamed protein product [Acanthoscelides obtectus]|uniref:Uncharacterized protein n=1 Tax=Acanthoscelides obtectus TaxID=200917 RepID=A0A9P0PVX0_ACAOB|nr:unnamed protein product [Acanthoscelides obtectus]CAH2000937.1 unnamed protein product [Acanthoscelides obtectus]CAK1670902.1 hypothetical protein AOBTE_LOCUS27905 [Acanthoscelides obtectus]CAK1674908.1 hypothetical protein AOBTE_LOCUS29808 [Acanthoscelides obtectus]